jgi:hypothetical protein
MSERVFWLPMIAVILGLLGTGSMAPAFARGGGGGGGAHGIGIARSPARVSPIFRSGRIGIPGVTGGLGGFQNNVFRGGTARRNSGLAGIWPYPWWPIDTTEGWPIDTTTAQVGTAVPSEPQVIVISGSNYAQGRIAPAPGDPPDYSYIPGCHAIPNGYHCDAPGHEAPAH